MKFAGKLIKDLATAIHRKYRANSKTLRLICSTILIATCGFTIAAGQQTPNQNNGILTASSATNFPAPVLTPDAPLVSAKAYVIMDAKSGAIIAQKNATTQRSPASLTKLMTLYIIFNALENGQINLNDRVPVSKKAWRMGGSKMFIREGTTVPVFDLIQGIIVMSGNDSCVAMAQFLAGNEKTFAKFMNTTAAQLGMTHSHFVDSTGLPHPDHYSTAADLAILARAIVEHFPDQYHWFKEKWFTYNKIRQPNRNRLLWRDPSVDGLKTGHTKAAGYCLIASGERDNTRLITVVMGTPSDAARSNDSQALLNYGFRYFTSKKILSANTALKSPRIWKGQQKHVDLALRHALTVSISKSNNAPITTQYNVSQSLVAPIVAGKTYGEVTVKQEGKVIARAPLIAMANVGTGNLWQRSRDQVLMVIEKK